MSDAPEWEDVSDWSGLPEVYLTKVQRQQGMFWRVEACSVPMAIGPEVPLVRRDPAVLADLPEVQAAVAAAVMEAADGLVNSFLHMQAVYAKEIAAITPYDPLQAFYEKEGVWSAIGDAKAAIRALIKPDAMAALTAYSDREVAKALERAWSQIELRDRRIRELEARDGIILITPVQP